MTVNKLLIAAAGSGKTSFLIKEALNVKDCRVLITTYTEANAEEIKHKFCGRIPKNITIQTWFSFLLEHGVRPFQSAMHDSLNDERIGFYLTEKQSGFRCNLNGKPIYWGEDNFFKYYFTKDLKIYSDKISKFIVDCNAKTNGAIINRISKVFRNIFIDEVQDLAGWELELIKLLFKSSSRILLVGDPRQVTYLTHPSKKHSKYKDGKIKEFIANECNRRKHVCAIDETTLQFSHRNNGEVCSFSSSLYPEYSPCKPCLCPKCRPANIEHQGIFVIKPGYVEEYCKKYHPQILHYNNSIYPELNFGKSKGLGFDRVLIYPTTKICNYLQDGKLENLETIRAKFYVAISRARYSVAIVYNLNNENNLIDGISQYPPTIL